MDNKTEKSESFGSPEVIIRPLNIESSEEIESIQKTLRSWGAQRFMDRVDDTSRQEVVDWASLFKRGETHLLLIVDDSGTQGFVYFYPSKTVEGALEVSFAKNPDYHKPFSEALKRAITQVPGYIEGVNRVVAEVDPDNSRSINLLKQVGFNYSGDHVWEIAVPKKLGID